MTSLFTNKAIGEKRTLVRRERPCPGSVFYFFFSISRCQDREDPPLLADRDRCVAPPRQEGHLTA